MIREMGEAYDLFFITGSGIQAVLYLRIIPKEEDFREMTEEEYEDYLKECPDETDENLKENELLNSLFYGLNGVACIKSGRHMFISSFPKFTYN